MLKKFSKNIKSFQKVVDNIRQMVYNKSIKTGAEARRRSKMKRYEVLEAETKQVYDDFNTEEEAESLIYRYIEEDKETDGKTSGYILRDKLTGKETFINC